MHSKEKVSHRRDSLNHRPEKGTKRGVTMKRTLSTLVLCFLVIPATALATIGLTSMGGFLFDIQETSGGQLSNGTSDAYDNCYYLTVNSVRYSSARRPHTSTAGGRHVHLPSMAVGELQVTRHIYVPATGGNFARYIDVVTNSTAAPIAATIEVSGNLGSDSSTLIAATSSGDTSVSVADHWIVSDDSGDGTGDPSLAHIAQGAGAPTNAAALSLTRDNYLARYVTMVPPMGQVAVMTFAVQERNRAMAQAEATRLSLLPSDALEDADTYLPDVVNFAVGGAPQIRFTGPTEVDEGDEFTVEVEVTDREGDPATWSWDLDDDEMFGETEGATSHTVSMGTTDGPSVLRFGVRASDGTDERTRYFSVTVNNVAPSLSSSPPLSAQVRREYLYMPTITDPAGALDEAILSLLDGPENMMVREDQSLSWTPPVDARGMSFPVELNIMDEDGDATTQSWEIFVNMNHAPEAPTPIRPIDRIGQLPTEPVTFTVMNSVDIDEDALTYFFRIDQASTFNSPLLMESPGVVEDASGMTSWTSPRTLNLGLWYWEVWATDGIDESPHAFGQFVSQRPVPDASVMRNDASLDAGAGGGSESNSGCSVTAPSEGATGPWWLVPVAILIVRRRR